MKLEMEDYFKNITLLPNQGLCNTNYLSIVENKKYVVRKFKLNSIDRKFEFKAQKAAFKAGIAAKPILLKKEYMICEFIEGIHKQKLNRKDLRLLALLLKKLHKVKIRKKQYILKLKNKARIKLQKMSKELVFCHHDLNPENILFSKRVKLIDWEFAGINDRYFDLASICVEFNLNKKDEEYFMRSYSKNSNIEKLELYKIVYKDLCQDWLKTNPHISL